MLAFVVVIVIALVEFLIGAAAVTFFVAFVALVWVVVLIVALSMLAWDDQSLLCESPQR